jgi:hypothetical protein
MELTETQKDALQRIYNDGGIDDKDTLIHKNTINSLNKKDLINYRNYANCTMWELTDQGLKELGVLH